MSSIVEHTNCGNAGIYDSLLLEVRCSVDSWKEIEFEGSLDGAIIIYLLYEGDGLLISKVLAAGKTSSVHE